MFKKILVANRGEIAVRVMRACREMGIPSVAVYSEVDRKALHVRYADEAYAIGPAASTESYLRIDRIIDAARQAGADALHPGYGFMAENPDFARACRDAGIVFIGPSAEAMELMGSKTTSRHTLVQAGLPVVPGTDMNLEDLREVRRVAQELGYPVMLKASAGGGGKGLRLVRSPAELDAAYREARSEAQNAFNDPSVYLEKYLDRPRHIEIQLLGDAHGNLIYLGERECSLQRRHQKVLEECPSPLLDADLRRRMGETAVRIGKLANYTNAGTVEFLVDQNRNFYFLEMNTRLQVEHPVTEVVVGIDLVKEQIRIAAGRRLEWRQEDVRLRGAAIECRIYAEDPARGFFPSPGLITRLAIPSGPGVREDSGVYEGWQVPLEYDPLLAKLIVWGTDREQAVGRMRRALSEYEVAGVKTNLQFFRQLVVHPEFAKGQIDTGFIDRMLAEGSLESSPPQVLESVAMLALALELRQRQSQSQQAAGRAGISRWKAAGRERLLNNWGGSDAALTRSGTK
ncbi:MAG: acetyl-CoA carboxylase biotin carboxylase subunit [Acidobacteria bacterium]|nr:acetyl-CoA carboxylase biotin carboxylase subunit [Acidobacteriota bacterium]